jgi:hypothetical protein
MQKLTLTIALTVFCITTKADVVQPNVVSRQFSISNLDKYPGYQFYYVYQGYHYDRGYQPNKPDTLAVENNKRYAAASRGDYKTVLLAKDKQGNWFVSAAELGGEGTVAAGQKGLVDAFRLDSIQHSTIYIKKIKEISQLKNGKEKTKKFSAGLISFIASDDFTTGLGIASLAALTGLLLLFIFRKKKDTYVAMAT